MNTNTWNAEDYAKNASAQQAWARALLDKLCLSGTERVLDIGCGDGKVTAELANRLPAGSVVGIDRSDAMIQFATSHYPSETHPNLRFLPMDARELTFGNEFDVVFSNATLQWIHDHVSVLQGISHSLRSQGRVLLQMGGRGNAVGIIDAIATMTQSTRWRTYFSDFSFPYAFYGPEEYQIWLKDANLIPARIELIPKDMTHCGPAGLAGWIRTTWFPYTQRVPEDKREDLIDEWVQTYLEQHPVTDDGLTHVRMVRLEVEAQKG